MKNNQKITIILFILIIFLIQIPVLANFNNVSFLSNNPSLSQANNVEIISESPYITKWDFYNQTGVGEFLYNETFDNGDYWDLYGVSERSIDTNQIATDDAFVYQGSPDTNYGSLTYLYTNHFSNAHLIYIKHNYPYLDLNTTDQSYLYAHLYRDEEPYSSGPSCSMRVCYASDFDESTLTWNNQGWGGQTTSDRRWDTGSNYESYILGSPSPSYMIREMFWNFFYKIDSSESAIPPYIQHHFSKNYHGSGYVYMQTDTTETLTLRSPDNLTLNLNSSQVVHIRFNTTSTRRIDFNLKNSGNTLKSYILSIQGNTNFNTRDVYLSVDGDYSIDQLEFTGIFDDTKNLIIDLVEIYVEEPAEIVYLDPDGYKQFYLDQPVNWTVKIYEKDILMDTQNFTTGSELQTLFFYKTEENAVYLTYYDSNNEYLSFNKYTTYANYTLGDILFSDKRMSGNILYVDDDTLIQFNIYDSFDALIRTYETYEETFVDITLDVYSLKIKNEATKYANYSLKNVGTDITKSGNIFPEEIIEFSISVGNYVFDYTNQENGQFYSINISLTGHQILILNTTYYDVYFLILSNDGEAVSENDIDLYINGTRSNLGFNTIESRYINVTIRDVFNFVIYSGIIDTDGITQCVIYLDLYSLNILNLYTFDDILVIASEIKYEFSIEHFPATYSFEGDIANTWDSTEDADCMAALDFVDTAVIQTGCYVHIIDEIDGHRKVMKLEDTSTDELSYMYIHNNFDSTQINGTVEFWVRLAQTDDGVRLFIGNTLLLHWDSSGDLQYYDGSYHDIETYNADQWYHIKIEFDCSCAIWYLWVDGVRKDSCGYGIHNSPPSFDDFRIYNYRWSNVDTATSYWDAIGYSWDSDYYIGNNMYWQWYFATYDFESDDISTSGHYYGDPTSFMDDVCGSVGTDIDFVDEYSADANCEASIIACLDGHKKVLNITDNNSTGSVLVYNYFTSDQTSGTIEWWWITDNCSLASYLHIYEEANIRITLMLNNCKYYYYNGTDYIEVLTGLSADQWYHHKIIFDCGIDIFDWYIDCVLKADDAVFRSVATYLDRIRINTEDADSGYSVFFDAFGYSWEDYTVSDNINPYGRPVDISTFIEGRGIGCNTSVAISGEFGVHKKFLNLTDYSPTLFVVIYNYFTEQTFGTVEMWLKTTDATPYNIFKLYDGGTEVVKLGINADKWMYESGAGWTVVPNVSDPLDDIWYHIRIDFECTTGEYMDLDQYEWEVTIDGVASGELGFANNQPHMDNIWIYTHTVGTGYSFYIDAIGLSWDTSGMYYHWDDYYFIYDNSSNYEIGHNLEPGVIPSGDYHYGDVNITEVISHEFFEEFRLYADHNYTISVYYTNGTFIESRNITLSDNGQIERFGTPSRTCFLSYADQRGIYLPFHNYKTYIDGVLIYENIIIRRIGTNLSIEIKDRYGISIKNSSYIVVDGDNFIAITLTMYSLKIYNQQEVFNWVNVTRDPNYYESENYWSEWLAPNEITEYMLFEGYYKVNITRNEEGSSSVYDYHLVGDDMLLVTSDNTITNTIINLQNVNTTLGNQITNVEINITNQNSAINNSVVNVNINLENVNSTLGDLLITQSIQITNIENNLTSLYVFTNNSFINLNSSINTYFVNIENNIISINDTISNLIIGIDNDIVLINTSISALIAGVSTDLSLINTSVSTLILDIDNDITLINQSISNLVIDIDNNVALINGTISTLIMDIGNDLMIMNSMIDTSFFFLNTTVAQIGNNITTNTILLNNSIFLTGNWINDSRIAILNNLALINNTIMTGINQIYTSVYLINNSIYTAVIDLGTSLTLENNKITGNLSIILQQNDFLTAIYNKTMFSELLNWSGVGYNFSIMEDRIDVFKFINDYRNQSVEIFLRYQDKVESMILSAQDDLEQWLPKQDVEYRLKSITTGEYLDEWKPLPENKTVNFGFYETEIDPGPIMASFTNIVILFFFFTLFAIIIVVLFIKFRKTVENYPLVYRTKKKKRTSTYNSRVYR